MDNKNKSNKNAVSDIEKLAESSQEFVKKFLESTICFMKDAAHWYEEARKRIQEYLSRFFSALSTLLRALAKLGLFYVPSIVLIFIGVATSSWIAYAAAAILAIAISIIGLNYKNKNSENPGPDQEE